MQGDFLVNIDKLQALESQYSYEAQIVGQLIYYLKRAQALSPEKSSVYQDLIKKCTLMSDYYVKLSEVSNNICDEVSRISQSAAQQFEDNITYLSQKLT